jgi:rhodanese-related sulfurtransferase
MFQKLTWVILCLHAQFALAAPAISPQNAKAAVDRGTAVLIDVREESELRQEGMAQPASWFPSSSATEGNQKFEAFKASLDPSKTVILYCRSGRRADAFAAKLDGSRFKIANMGGFDAWKAAGLPIKAYP